MYSLQGADLEGVLDLLKADFDNATIGRTFGQLTIHHKYAVLFIKFVTSYFYLFRLSLEQLDGLLKHKPGLIDQTEFVSRYISLLSPHESVDITTNLDARGAYVNKVMTFND